MSSTRTERSPLAAIGLGVPRHSRRQFPRNTPLSGPQRQSGKSRGHEKSDKHGPHDSAQPRLGRDNARRNLRRAFTVDRFERPLLVIVPAVFVAPFLFVAGVSILSNALPRWCSYLERTRERTLPGRTRRRGDAPSSDRSVSTGRTVRTERPRSSRWRTEHGETGERPSPPLHSISMRRTNSNARSSLINSPGRSSSVMT